MIEIKMVLQWYLYADRFEVLWKSFGIKDYTFTDINQKYSMECHWS